MSTYEDRLSADLEWALSEGSRFFDERGAVQATLRRIAERLDALAIPYAVAGGMALFAHGVRRFTEDVDILVSADSLRRIHEQLSGRGYVPPHRNSRNLQDTDTGVRIEFLVSGQYPGDGKSKALAFPAPDDVSVLLNGVRYLNLQTLLNLKLASGMTGVGRAKDLGDVEQLIQLLDAPESLADELDPYVRAEYQRIWRSLHFATQRYLWACPANPTPEEAARIQAMRAAGALLEDRGQDAGAYQVLVTTDAAMADEFDMVREEEFFHPGELPPSS